MNYLGYLEYNPPGSMAQDETRSRELLELALQEMWRGEIDSAIALYDRAREQAESDDLLELIAIRKAEALIAAERETDEEVGLLARIVMRRRSPRHVYLAAYALLRRFSERSERQRALFYGQIARDAAVSLGEAIPQANVLNGIGITSTADSRFDEAIVAFEEGLGALSALDEDDYVRSLRSALLGNLGGAKVLAGNLEEGIVLLERALETLEDDFGRAEAYLDLAYASLQLGHNERAQRFGTSALKLACIDRQVRSANHVLAETAFRDGRHEEAERHLDVVAGFYPDFPKVKEWLMAIDLCSVVNWKV